MAQLTPIMFRKHRSLGWNMFAVLLMTLSEVSSAIAQSQSYGGTGFIESDGLLVGQRISKPAVDSAGNLYLVGSFSDRTDFDTGPGTHYVNPGNADDETSIFITKQNASGSRVWTRDLFAIDVPQLDAKIKNTRVFVSPDDATIYIFGSFSGKVDFDPGVGVDERTGDSNFLASYTSDGVYVSTQLLHVGTSTVDIVALRPSDGSLLFGGLFQGEVDFDPGPGEDIRDSGGGTAVYLSRLNSDLSYGETKRLSGADFRFQSLEFDAHGNTYLQATFIGNGFFGLGGWVDLGNYNQEDVNRVAIVKYSPGLDVIWAQGFGDYNGLLHVAPNGELYSIGSGNFFERDNIDFDPGPGIDRHPRTPLFITKYSSDRTYLWTKTLTAGHGGVAIGSDSRIYITGTFGGRAVDLDPSEGQDIHDPLNNSSYYLLSLNSDGELLWARSGRSSGNSNALNNVLELALSPTNDIYLLGQQRGTYDFSLGAETDLRPRTSTSAIFLSKFRNDVFTILGKILPSSETDTVFNLSLGSLGNVSTVSDHRFFLENIPLGTSYSVEFIEEDFETDVMRQSGDGTGITRHDFLVTPKSGLVKGLLLQDDKRIDGARIVISSIGTPISRSGFSDKRGKFFIDDVPSGRNTILVIKNGQIILEENFDLAPNGTVNIKRLIGGPSAPSTRYAFWNGFLGMVNILELINHNESEANLAIAFRDIDGNLISSTDVTLPPKSQRDVVLNDLEGFSANSYGLLSVSYQGAGSPNYTGRTVYYLPDLPWNSTFHYAFAVSLLEPIRGSSSAIFNSFNPSQNLNDSGVLVPTWLSVANMDSTPQNFVINYFDQAGTAISSRTILVPPFGKRDVQAGHEFSSSAAVGQVSITPEDQTVSYIATIKRYGLSGEAGRYGFAFGIPSSPGDSGRVTLPIGAVPGALSVVELANASDHENNVTLSWYDSAGRQLRNEELTFPPRSQIHLLASSVLGPGQFGSLFIDGNREVLAGSATYFYDPRDLSVISAEYTESHYPLGKVARSSFNTFLRMINYLRLINTSSEPERIIVDFQSGGSFALELPAFAREDIRIPNATNNSAGEYGAFTISSDSTGTVSGSVIRQRQNFDGTPDNLYATPVR